MSRYQNMFKVYLYVVYNSDCLLSKATKNLIRYQKGALYKQQLKVSFTIHCQVRAAVFKMCKTIVQGDWLALLKRTYICAHLLLLLLFPLMPFIYWGEITVFQVLNDVLLSEYLPPITHEVFPKFWFGHVFSL